MTMTTGNWLGAALVWGAAVAGLGCEQVAEVDAPSEANVPEATVIASNLASKKPESAKPESAKLEFSYATDMNRVGGAIDDGAFVCKRGSCQGGIVAFGPYTRSVAAGPHVATFFVGGLGLATLAREVASLDVFNASANERLSLRSLSGPELPDRQVQHIEVPFTAPESAVLEFRVGWAGDGELRMYRVDVR